MLYSDAIDLVDPWRSLRMCRCAVWSTVLVISCAALSGCGKSTAPNQTASGGGKESEKTGSESKKSAETTENKPKRKSFQPVEINATGSAGNTPVDSGERIESARVALKPLQILIGNWEGSSRKGIHAALNWAWDLKSDPKKPALRIKSEKSAYITDGRLTFSPATQEYELSATDAEGKNRTYLGKFTQEVQDVPGDDKKLQRTYKLELTEPKASDEGEQWRIVINQQENSRYILELERKRGSGPFIRVDSINTQREGTSFAISDTDYGEKTCVVSQGLGTTEVKHGGKSYWVCCSGCKAAFEDDPEKWIAKYEAMKKDKMPKQ